MRHQYHNHAPDPNGYIRPRRTHRYFHHDHTTERATDRAPWHRETTPNNDAEEALKNHLAALLLACCTPKQAEVLELIYGQHLTHDEAARILGVTRQAVAQHLAAGLRRIQRAVEEGTGNRHIQDLGWDSDPNPVR